MEVQGMLAVERGAGSGSGVGDDGNRSNKALRRAAGAGEKTRVVYNPRCTRGYTELSRLQIE